VADNGGIEQVKDQVTDQVSNGNGSGASRLLSKEILIPAAATAVTAAAAGLAASKGPDLKNKLVGTAKQGAQELGKSGAEGAKQEITGGGGGVLGAVAGGAKKLLPGGGGGGGGKKTRRLPIQRWTDVALPLDEVYEKWTDFEEYPKFMHRVLSVEQPEDDVVEWEEKIWFSKRQWKATITDNRKNDRIAWKTETGTNHTGIVSFHKLDAKLTRVMVTVDFQPTGLMEKMASGLRFVKRAVQADLARFKAYVELEDAEGVEYESVPEKNDEKQDEQDEQKNERSQSSSSNGGDDASDEERDAERKEREERRKERREALSAS
jgi:uncharacterized membrane protein